MKVRRIAGVAALGAAAASLVVIPTAGADESIVDYAVSSAGQSLELSAFGEQLTIGKTTTDLDSLLNASASGLGLATSAFQGGVSTASVSGEGIDGSAEETCEAVVSDVPGVSIAMACSASLAQVVDGVPSSIARGRITDAVINPVQPLLETPLSDIVAPVEDAVDQLVDALRPLTTAVDENLDLGLESTVDDLFDSLFAGADLVKLSVGETVATSSVAADALSASCASEGARVDLLDLPATVAGIDPAPVASIIVGQASTLVDVSKADATATPTVQPSIVRVVVPSMGLDQQVGPGDTVEIPLPEPLGLSRVTVADGTTGVDANGNTFATADAVAIDLLDSDALSGGIHLALASCSSVAGAAVQQIPVTTTAAITPPAQNATLPKTGSNLPNAAAVATALGLSAAGLALLRRSRILEG